MGQGKIVLVLVGAGLVAGAPEPNPETDVKIEVQGNANSYLDMVKDAAGSSISLITNWMGVGSGEDCCWVDDHKYLNGATDVPCPEPRYPAGTLGLCNEGHVECEDDQITETP